MVILSLVLVITKTVDKYQLLAEEEAYTHKQMRAMPPFGSVGTEVGKFPPPPTPCGYDNSLKNVKCPKYQNY